MKSDQLPLLRAIKQGMLLSGLKEFYNVNESEGIIVNKRLGNRAFFLGVEPWTSLTEQLSKTFGSGAEVILFGIGRSYGMSVAAEEKKVKAEAKPSMDFLLRLATLAGWGKITISRDASQNLKVTVRNCVFCAAMKDPKEREIPCFFLRGILSGFAEALRGTNKIEEVHCDSDYCEFMVSFTDQKN